MPAPGTSPLFPSDLSGRRAVVTGAAHGIGYAIALRLAQSGARVIALDINSDPLIKKIEHTHCADWEGLDCTVVGEDLGESPKVDPVRLAESLNKGHERDPVQLIVNNVGICSGTGYFDTSLEDYDRVQRTNLRNPLFFTRRLVEPLMKKGLPGSVLFISSVHRSVPSRRPQYDISKAGVSQAARNLAMELGPNGIRVNAISPGWIDTTGGEDREKAARMIPQIPLGRAGAPDDVAKLAVFLLSDHCAGYLTGVDVPWTAV